MSEKWKSDLEAVGKTIDLLKRELFSETVARKSAESELAKLKQQADAMANKLEWIAERYDDSKAVFECASDAYDMKCVAAEGLQAYRAYSPKAEQ